MITPAKNNINVALGSGSTSRLGGLVGNARDSSLNLNYIYINNTYSFDYAFEHYVDNLTPGSLISLVIPTGDDNIIMRNIFISERNIPFIYSLNLDFYPRGQKYIFDNIYITSSKIYQFVDYTNSSKTRELLDRGVIIVDDINLYLNFQENIYKDNWIIEENIDLVI